MSQHDYNKLVPGVKRLDNYSVNCGKSSKLIGRCYTSGTLIVPSVSTIAYDHYPPIPDEYKWTGAWGDCFHDAALALSEAREFDVVINAKVPFQDPVDKMKSCIDKWLEFEQKHEFITEFAEQMVFSEKYLVGGTFDRVIWFQGKKYIMDFKTGSPNLLHSVTNEAYRRIYSEMTGETIGNMLIYVPRTDKPISMNITENLDYVFNRFLNLQTLWRWQHQKEMKALGWSVEQMYHEHPLREGEKWSKMKG